jgi:hypothetical protein
MIVITVVITGGAVALVKTHPTLQIACLISCTVVEITSYTVRADAWNNAIATELIAH